MAVDYHRYLASRDWRLKRNAVIERAGNSCERCKARSVQAVHHLTYERLGQENPDTDLLGVCKQCHQYLSGDGNQDPAVLEALRCIEIHGLIPVLAHEGNWNRLMEWNTGPSAAGSYFHGMLLPTDKLEPDWFGDYHDATRFIVPLPDGVWFHCGAG